MQNKIIRAVAMLSVIGLMLPAWRLQAQSHRATAKSPASSAPNAAQLDLLYQQAAAAFAQQDWMQALIKFERVHAVQPSYRDTAQLMAQSRANLLKQAQAGAGIALDQRTVLIAIASISLLGLFCGLPVNRARLHRMFGNHARAAMIYERLVFRKPRRTKLYAPLAEAYVRLNRRDATAMRIYKRVLELNLPTALRAELHNLVTGYNLDAVQTKWHVNTVLDSRLEKNLTKRLETPPPPAKPLVAEAAKTPRRAAKPAKKKIVFADYGYAGGLFSNGKLQIEKY